MNERIIELAEQAGLSFENNGSIYALTNYLDCLKHFAQLVRQEEREACAKMLENKYTNGDNCECWLESMAEEIRGRTE
jgi:hypothetical protein